MQPMNVSLDPDTAEQLRQRWWVFLVTGGLSALVGLVIVVRPIAGVFGLALLIATGLIVTGVTELASASRWPSRWVPIVFGGASLLAGIGTVVWPDITLWVLAVLIGVSLVMRGILRAAGSLAARPPMWGFFLGLGLAEAVLGVLALTWPGATIVVLALIMGFNLLIMGGVEIAFAFQAKRLGEGGGLPPAAT